jgi:hypothetical protein
MPDECVIQLRLQDVELLLRVHPRNGVLRQLHLAGKSIQVLLFEMPVNGDARQPSKSQKYYAGTHRKEQG